MERNASHKRDRLYFLDKYTRGNPKELVRSCQYMAPDRGYTMAKHLLREHFGNKQKITAAYMEKVLSWPGVKQEDVKSLQAYALFLRECCNTMEDVLYMRELDMPANMRAIMLKLPYTLKDKLRGSACERLDKFDRRARFVDLVAFIEHEVKIVSDPTFRDIQNTQLVTVNKIVNRTTAQSKPRFKGNSYATTVATVEPFPSEQSTKYSQVQCQGGSSAKNTNTCVCCSQGHPLERCPRLKEETHRDKINFLKEFA